MALREHSRPVPAGRSGRHGRPRPFGGRLRLPTIRFSGAAMAMSTVVGISLATTWLLNEQQQQVGRRIGVTVGGPPVPSPDATPAESPAPAPGSTLQAAPATAAGAPAPSTGRPSNNTGTGTGTGRPTAAATSAPPLRLAEDAADTSAADATATPPPAAPPSTAASTPPAPLAPSPSAPPSPSAKPSPSAPATLPATLHGTARLDTLGPTGTRHTLRLDLDEAMTALQVEFRLNRPAALPGSTPATDLPGALVTVALERDTLVYRFTTPADLPLRPGSYTFTMTGTTAPPGTAPAAPETWTASAFALPTTRALAARGTF
ncbi:hypothetical protein AB0O31_27800 [Kitasatospora cineracea]|uniref:hypothetical protein n=1 Tax=Kitasatospora cineracea TaxID=88074 RepID=UPI00343B30D8